MLASLYPSVSHLADPAQPKGDLTVRMIDMGCARACPDECSLEGLSGTPVYMAPEVAAGSQYGPASDLWGVGVLLYQMLTGKFPYWDCSPAELRALPLTQVLQDVGSGAVLLDTPSVAALSPDARDLLRALLERDPERRIGAHAALRHAWLARHGLGPAA
jgi:serine/threonine protein kinase